MDRKLVTVRVINEVKVHPNADKLELAIIGGWQVVVGKDQFKAGDEIVYFEIDSLIPISPEFEFLRKYAYVNKGWLKDIIPNAEGFRIRSIKLRGEISQGLIIPIPDQLRKGLKFGDFKSHEDIADYFGVVKYDPPVVISGNTNVGKKGNFPEFIIKTKQERIQNIPKSVLQDAIANKEKFEVTRKYHGSSITVYSKLEVDNSFFGKICSAFKTFLGMEQLPVYKVGVCSHNVELDTSNKDNSFVKTALDTGLIKALDFFTTYTGRELAIQGELCGPTLHNNHHGLDANTIFIFDIFDINEQRYLLPIERSQIVDQLINDYNFTGYRAQMEFHYMELISDNAATIISLGEYKLPNGTQNEGLVWKSLSRDFSFKAVSNQFLLEDK